MNIDLLTQRYLDGTLTSEEMAVFQQHLREDGELREHLRAVAEQAVAFGDLARSEPVAAVERPTKSGRTSWLALAASLAVLAASALLFLSNRQPAVLLEEPLRLLATGSSVIRYRLRQEEPGSLQFMLLTHRAEGGFGGNFECKIGAEELQPDADGWCEVAIPITRFEPIDSHAHQRQRHPTAAGNVITSAIVSSYLEDRNLTVARFELIEE